MQRNLATRMPKWLHGGVKQMTRVTSETGRIGEEPHYAFLEVLNTAQNEHGIIGHTRWHDPSATRALLLSVPVLDFFPDGVRAHVIGFDLEDFAIGGDFRLRDTCLFPFKL